MSKSRDARTSPKGVEGWIGGSVVYFLLPALKISANPAPMAMADPAIRAARLFIVKLQRKRLENENCKQTISNGLYSIDCVMFPVFQLKFTGNPGSSGTN